MRPRPSLLIVTNAAQFFLSHRLPLALKARDRGFDVHIASGIEDPADESRIREHAFHFHRLSVSRGGMNPVAEIRLVRELVRLYRQVNPTVIHHVALKAVLYGGIAARISGIGRTVNSFTGMGYLFSAKGWLPRFVRSLVWIGLRFSLGGRFARAIVQNQENLRSLVSRRVIASDRIDLIRGSGVDLGMFAFQPLPSGVPVVLLVGRMLIDKGVVEFLDAADLLLARGVRARFLLAGDVDPENPASLTKEYLAARKRGSDIDWLGHRRDVAALMRDSTIVCLPSYHEGLPKTLLEAASTGRPMVATDIPGCREVVVHGVTGLLVPMRAVLPLADAIQSLIEDRARCERMGAAARAKAEAEFGDDEIVSQTLEVYSRLLNSV